MDFVFIFDNFLDKRYINVSIILVQWLLGVLILIWGARMKFIVNDHNHRPDFKKVWYTYWIGSFCPFLAFFA